MTGRSSMSIGFLNYFDANYSRIGAISVPNKKAYCARHGYDYLLSHASLAPERPASWNKVRLFQKYIQDYDWLFWNDADTLITNPDQRLEDITDPDYPFIVGSDGALNCGNILVHNVAGIETALETWWNEDSDIFHYLWEQKALAELIEKEPWWAENVQIVPQAVMNSYPVTYQPGDFLVHFAGYGRQPEVLEAMMREWADRLPNELKLVSK